MAEFTGRDHCVLYTCKCGMNGVDVSISFFVDSRLVG